MEQAAAAAGEITFDARAAKALKPGEHIKFAFAPGLRLVAFESTRAWIYRYKNAVGQMKQIKLGNWPAMGFPAALAAWDTKRQERNAGQDPALVKRERAEVKRAAKKAERFTVAALRQTYLERYRGTVTDKSFKEAFRLLHRHLESIENKQVSKVTRTDAFELIDGMRDTPVLAQRVRQLCGDMWDLAHDSGQLSENVPNWWRMILRGDLPSKGKIVDGKHQGVVKRALSEAELRKLVPWLPNFSRTIEDGLTLGLWTLCRGAEIVKMTREEISEEDGVLWWTIPKAKLKSLRNPLTVDHRVPLIGRAAQVVRRRMEAEKGSYLFSSRAAGGHIEQKVFGVAVWMHMPECDLRPDWSRSRLPVSSWAPHDLRRTGRTMLEEMDCPERVGEAILGHAVPGVQGRYNRHTYDKQKLDWLTRWAERLEQIAQPAPAAGR